MRKLGISILAVCYFGAGSSIGSILFDLWHGRGDQVFHAYGILAFTALANLVLLPCLLFIWRQRNAEPDARQSAEMRPSSLLLPELPFNNRIAFLLFSVAWVIGFLVPIVFGF